VAHAPSRVYETSFLLQHHASIWVIMFAEIFWLVRHTAMSAFVLCGAARTKSKKGAHRGPQEGSPSGGTSKQ
jgi:hypothetical protein